MMLSFKSGSSIISFTSDIPIANSLLGCRKLYQAHFNNPEGVIECQSCRVDNDLKFCRSPLKLFLKDEIAMA